MSKPKVILRADGGQGIGMGHFIRTLALGEMLSNDFYCVYATKNPSNYQLEEINKVCDEWIELPEDDSHFDTFLKFLKGDEIVVLDNYYFDTGYQKKIKDIGCKLVCIDDMHDKHYVADVVINHAEGVDSDSFSTESHTKLLLGYKYALLRKPFFQRKHLKQSPEYDIIIGIGGTDPYDITFKLTKKILSKSDFSKIAILAGAAYNGEAIKISNSRAQVFKSVSAEEVSQLITSSRLGVFPASTIAIEATAMRLPFLTGYFVDNQTEIYKGIIDNQLGIGLGDLTKIDTNEFYEKLMLRARDSNLMQLIKDNHMKYLDGKAPSRINEVFATLV